MSGVKMVQVEEAPEVRAERLRRAALSLARADLAAAAAAVRATGAAIPALAGVSGQLAAVVAADEPTALRRAAEELHRRADLLAAAATALRGIDGERTPHVLREASDALQRCSTPTQLEAAIRVVSALAADPGRERVHAEAARLRELLDVCDRAGVPLTPTEHRTLTHLREHLRTGAHGTAAGGLKEAHQTVNEEPLRLRLAQRRDLVLAAVDSLTSGGVWPARLREWRTGLVEEVEAAGAAVRRGRWGPWLKLRDELAGLLLERARGRVSLLVEAARRQGLQVDGPWEEEGRIEARLRDGDIVVAFVGETLPDVETVAAGDEDPTAVEGPNELGAEECCRLWLDDALVAARAQGGSARRVSSERRRGPRLGKGRHREST